ncbi:MAG: hypothetical protein M1482_15775 [Chloroflexi bacterium]|nr:hypothetical protein [Chloroflexota bacterium]
MPKARTVFAQDPAPTPYRYYYPLISRASSVPPAATYSRYMGTVDSTTLYNEGCAQAGADQNGIVVLDFGAPRVQSGVYGTRLFGVGGFASTSQIETAATWFLQGYWNCSPSDAHIVLAIGTTNCGQGSGSGPCNPGGGNVSSAHGQAWAQMVGGVNDWITASSYNSKMAAAGANDMEPGWNSPTDTRAWVDGFFSLTPTVALYNFGSCDSCPYSSCPSCTPLNGWALDDIWYVSWGASGAYPVPEIYLSSGANADQWYRMGVYGFVNHGSSMDFQGTFTQWQACQDVGSGACPYTGNSPSTGWTQLYNALNADARTQQPLNWSTDITWQN